MHHAEGVKPVSLYLDSLRGSLETVVVVLRGNIRIGLDGSDSELLFVEIRPLCGDFIVQTLFKKVPNIESVRASPRPNF